MANDDDTGREPFFRITVTRVEHVRSRETEYVKLADTGGPDGGTKYGWTEKPSGKIERVERELLRQEVADLDLRAVIAAVNNLPTWPEKEPLWVDPALKAPIGG